MTSLLKQNESVALDIIKRTAYTAAEAGAAAATSLWAASGLNNPGAVDMSSGSKISLSLLVAVIGAALTAGRASVAQLLTNKTERGEITAVLSADTHAFEDAFERVILRHGLTPPMQAGNADAATVVALISKATSDAGSVIDPTIPGTVPATDDDTFDGGTVPALPADDPTDAEDSVSTSDSPALVDPGLGESTGLVLVTVYDANGNALGQVDPTDVVNGEPAAEVAS